MYTKQHPPRKQRNVYDSSILGKKATQHGHLINHYIVNVSIFFQQKHVKTYAHFEIQAGVKLGIISAK